jgi:hypothetical protein
MTEDIILGGSGAIVDGYCFDHDMQDCSACSLQRALLRHQSAWSPMWVKLNTLATIFGAFTGIVALIVAVIALTS